MFSSISSRTFCCLLATPLLLMLSLAGPAVAGQGSTLPEPGYLERACGFDLDDDGIPGEKVDDCQICNGSTTDPDGDGVDEDLIYVDCDNGSDQPTCGSAGQPCRTIDYAWSQRADGPGDGAEDIVCFKGTCSPNDISPSTRGVAGTKTRPASNTEARAFEYPRDPAMLVGWDSDGDGNYPPFDTDDVAVLDGAPGKKSRALTLNTGFDNSYFELAHFSARDYNRYDNDPEGGFLKANRSRDATHLYVHDIDLSGIGQDQQGSSGNISFDLFGAEGLRYFALENLRSSNTGGFFLRGSGGDGPRGAGPFRFQGLDISAHGCDQPCDNQAWFLGMKVWGHVTGFEVLDSVFDCNMSEWDGASCGAIAIPQCVQDVDIRNNRFIDNRNPIVVQGAATGYCDGSAARPVDDVMIEQNQAHNAFPWKNGVEMVSIRSGSGAATARETVANVTIRNNSFSSRNAGYSGCLSYFGGNSGEPNPGTIRFLNNTCWGTTSQGSMGAITLYKNENFVHQNFEIRNNVLQGLKSFDANLRLAYAPTGWAAGSNSYDPGAGFRWNGKDVDFETWKSLTKGDAGSNRCRALLENPEEGDLRLQFVDTCAQDRGLTLEDEAQDRQGDPRIGPWDRGADEITIDDRESISLLGGRFRVAMQFDTGKFSGTARPGSLTDDSAFFTFFDGSNIEAVVKVLDGCSTNGSVWVFGAGLTNLAAAIRVEDTVTGSFWSYSNPAGKAFAPIQDTRAFSSCP